MTAPRILLEHPFLDLLQFEWLDRSELVFILTLSGKYAAKTSFNSSVVLIGCTSLASTMVLAKQQRFSLSVV
jgi:hypothetical protein